MSEKLLDGLMHLFALLARDGSVTEEETQVVRNFLRQQVPQSQVSHFLNVFQKYANSIGSAGIVSVSNDVNRELTQKQKLVVVVLLMELIYADRQVSLAEARGLAHVASQFNIHSEDFSLLEEFIQRTDPERITSQHLLRIGPISDAAAEGGRSIHLHELPGFIAVLHFHTYDTFLIRYHGTGEVTLNGQALVPGKVYFLAPGSVLRYLHHTPVFFSDIMSRLLRTDEQTKLVFEARDLAYRFPSGKVGLHGVNLREQGGCMIGLMGASGSGKSTLLNVLNGNLVPSKGSVTINGVDIHRKGKGGAKTIEGVIGYVSQDDLLVEELTVYENLFFNAKLCFADKSDNELEVLVMKLLTSLGLAETRDIPVGSPLNKKISGGQRKRLNIALELIREPQVLFVDEPTSGLSSRDSENIMDLLKELALRGKLVFVVIHQPSSDIFKMFDQLFILDVGGWPIYYGNPVEAVSYFKREAGMVVSEHPACTECGNVNPEVIFNIIETKVLDEHGNFSPNRRLSPQDWNASFKSHFAPPKREPAPAAKPQSTLRLPSRFKQWLIFLVRDIKSKLANTSYLVINFLEAPILAIILGGILRYWNTDADTSIGYTLYENLNLPAYLFISILVALFMGLTVSAEEILRDRRIRKREAFLHLSKRSYLLSKITLLFAVSAIQTGTFVLIGNNIMGIHDMGINLSHWWVLFSISCFANLLGLNVSATFDNAVTIYILVPILLIPQIILSGVIVKFEKLNPSVAAHGSVPVIGDVMASRWAYEALAVKFYRDNPYERQFFRTDKQFSEANYKMGFWLRKLEGELSFVQLNHGKSDKREEVEETLDLLHRELQLELRQFGQPFPELEQLSYDNWRLTTGEAVSKLLLALRNLYSEQANNALRVKEQNMMRMQADSTSRTRQVALKLASSNESLADLVLNRNDELKILELDGRLIRNSEPIYHEVNPDGRFWLNYRVHFFAPNKPVFGRRIDTFQFNMTAVWLMSLLLYITLYFESFRKLIAGRKKG